VPCAGRVAHPRTHGAELEGAWQRH
jgi:hypothetical protein